MYPDNLQHPLAASRLIIFGLYGPLDGSNKLRSGRRGEHVLMEYELDAMCEQIEREDLVQIYLHRQRDMGLLSTEEQDALINQADAHLKKEKGKAMLPKMTKLDVVDLFKSLRRYGPSTSALLNFHEAQKVITDYRQHRISQYKLVFPALTSKTSSASSSAASLLLTTGSSSTANLGESKALTLRKMMSTYQPPKTLSNAPSNSALVGPHIAPRTMFLRNQGLTTADLIEQNTKYLSKHAYKVTDIDGPASAEITYNVKLLREVSPKYDNPYETSREDWNSSAVLKGAGLGSMVKGVQAGATTWKRKYTSY
jgi:saccharopepsin